MRLLDVGCGPGDVAMAASRLVGPTGTVIAVDAADVVELARARAAQLAACEIQFNNARLTTSLWTSLSMPWSGDSSSCTCPSRSLRCATSLVRCGLAGSWRLSNPTSR